eukprot:scaffold7709_cov62-Phaeocystis_antarctica.AAC.4
MGVEQDFDAVRPAPYVAAPHLSRVGGGGLQPVHVPTRAACAGMHVCVLQDGRAAARAAVGEEAVRRPAQDSPRPARLSLTVLLLRAAAAKRWRASTLRTSARRAAASCCSGCLT